MSGANLHVGPKLAQPPPALEKPLLLCPDEAGSSSSVCWQPEESSNSQGWCRVTVSEWLVSNLVARLFYRSRLTFFFFFSLSRYLSQLIYSPLTPYSLYISLLVLFSPPNIQLALSLSTHNNEINQENELTINSVSLFFPRTLLNQITSFFISKVTPSSYLSPIFTLVPILPFNFFYGTSISLLLTSTLKHFIFFQLS